MTYLPWKIKLRCLAVLVFCVALPLLPKAAFSQDLGGGATVYGAGRSSTDQIKDFLAQQMASGQLQKKQAAWREKQLSYIKNPPDLKVPSNLSYATTKYALLYKSNVSSPLISAQSPLKPGQQIKPLELIPNVALLPTLIFINGNDQRQLSYALAYRKVVPNSKIVITAGPWLDLTNRYHPIFYDQQRVILDSFATNYGIQISSVPAIVSFTNDRQMLLTNGLPSGY